MRLKALLPPWLPWIRVHYTLTRSQEQQRLAISARQIDRRLRAHKTKLKKRFYGRTKPGTLLKHQIPIRTEHWDVTEPGFVEIDLVSHSGNAATVTSPPLAVPVLVRVRPRHNPGAVMLVAEAQKLGCGKHSFANQKAPALDASVRVKIQVL